MIAGNTVVRKHVFYTAAGVLRVAELLRDILHAGIRAYVVSVCFSLSVFSFPLRVLSHGLPG